MRRPLLSIPCLLALGACHPPGGSRAPASEDAEPTVAGQPQVFAEVESLPRDEPDQGAAKPDPGVMLDPRAVDASLSNMVGPGRVRVDYDADHPWLGASEPIVTAVVFVDYECPHCANADAQLTELVAAHPNDLRVVVRMMPLALHRRARSASLAALAAHEQGQFGPIHARLFTGRDALEQDALAGHAAALGLDMGRFAADMSSAALAQRVDLDRAFAERVGVVGVPTIFVDGREADIDTLGEIVDEELALAKSMIDAGAPRREVWARKMAVSEAK